MHVPTTQHVPQGTHTFAPSLITPTNLCRHVTDNPSQRGANGWRTVKYKGIILQKFRVESGPEASKHKPAMKQKTSKDVPVSEQSSPTSVTTSAVVLPKTLPVNSRVLDTNATRKRVLVVVRIGKKYGFTRPLGDLNSNKAEAKWLITDLLSAHHDYLRRRQNEKKKNERKTKEKPLTSKFRVGSKVEAKCKSSVWTRGKITKVYRQPRLGIPRWAFAQVMCGDQEIFLRRVDMQSISVHTHRHSQAHTHVHKNKYRDTRCRLIENGAR